jgi:hypothetical protein
MRTCVPVAAIALAAVACTVNSTTNNNGSPVTGDDGGITATPDSGTPDGALAAADADDGAAPQAFVRLAHWSPDAPAVDVCFNPAGGTWSAQSPALGQVAVAPDGGAAADAGDAGDDGAASATGVTFPSVTSYLIIAPGTYGVRLVAAGGDCSTGLVDLPSVVLRENTYTTVAALGEVTPVGTDQALKLGSFTDDVTAPAAQIALRFVNASPNASLAQADLGTGSLVVGNGGSPSLALPFSALFTGVAFGAAGAPAGTDAGAVDANGYLAEAALAGSTLSVHATNGAQDTTIALNDVTINGGSAATIALINGVSNGSAASAAKLLLCADADDSSSTSLFAQCSIVSTD